jgi:flagellar biosynthesis/type III secretory pathway M-ring protein FliF/YscJ
MDVSNVPNQARAIFAQMSPGQKVTMVLFGLSIVAMLIAVMTWGAKPTMEQVTMPLAPEQVENAKKALTEAGIDFKMVDNKVQVKAGDAVRAKQTLVAANAVPGEKIFGIEKLGDMTALTPIGVQAAYQQRYMEDRVGRMIRSMKGVEAVEVKFQTENGDTMERFIPSEKRGAFITVKMAPGQDLSQKAAENMIRAVAAVDLKIARDKVVLVDAGNRDRQFKILDGDTTFAAGAQWFEAKAAIERNYVDKITNFFLGLGIQAQVGVEVTWDMKKMQETRKELIAGMDAISLKKRFMTENSTTMDQFNPAGEVPNAEPLRNPKDRLFEREKRDHKEGENDNFIPSVMQLIETTPGIVTGVKAAVVVMDRIVEEKVDGEIVIKHDNMTNDPKRVEEFKRMVMNMITPLKEPGGKAPEAMVELSYMPMAHLAVQMPKVTAGETVVETMRKYRYLAVAGLSLIALMMLFSMYRRSLPLPEIEVVQEVGGPRPETAAAQGAGGPDRSTMDPHLQDMQGKIRRMVDKDAQKAAGLLRRWMSRERAERAENASGGGRNKAG